MKKVILQNIGVCVLLKFRNRSLCCNEPIHRILVLPDELHSWNWLHTHIYIYKSKVGVFTHLGRLGAKSDMQRAVSPRDLRSPLDYTSSWCHLFPQVMWCIAITTHSQLGKLGRGGALFWLKRSAHSAVDSASFQSTHLLAIKRECCVSMGVTNSIMQTPYSLLLYPE